jgi:cytosine/adenosine deaminase-related metal-dependent hydrolase
MILRARTVATMEGAPIENGGVCIEGDRIVEVGKFSEVKRHRAGEVLDLGEQVLLPGLINAHCHLDYTCLRGKIPRSHSFTDWIRAINAEKAKLSPNDYVLAINEGFVEARHFGTTTIANLTAFPELIGQIEAPIRACWFAELIDVREPKRACEMVDRAVEFLKCKEHWGLAPHALFTASAELYRECAKRASFLTTHLAESNEEMRMFRDAEGPLFQFMKEIGRDLRDCGVATPTHIFSGIRGSSTLVGMAERQWLLVHVNEVADADLELLLRSRDNISIIHCPRSHRYFRRAPFQLQKFFERGLNVCLGTDSLASNEDLSLFGEMRGMREAEQTLSPTQILKMATINPARALGMGDEIGQIRAGFLADLIAVPAGSWDEVIDHKGGVSWMMTGGKVTTPSAG